MINLTQMGKNAKAASRILATLSSAEKNTALYAIADEIEAQADLILAENEKDIAEGKQAGLSQAILDRLLLTEKRIFALAADTRKVAALPDPVGSVIDARVLPNGLRLSKRRIPIGVLGVIYEARPNVTIDIAVLSLKTGNAAILRGGKETLRSNLVLVKVIQSALEKAGLPLNAIQMIDTPDRALVREFLRLDRYVDMLIPRGGFGAGGGYCGECEGTASQRVQCFGYAPCPRGGGREIPSASRCSVGSQQGGTARGAEGSFPPEK